MLKLIETNPDIAPAGNNRGIFTDVRIVSGKNEEGDEFKDLVLFSELDAVDSSGKKFQLEKRYSLLPKSRGLAAFRNDYRSWSGKKLTDKEMAAFDENMLLKKPAVFVTIHTKSGKHIDARIDGFLPAGKEATA